MKRILIPTDFSETATHAVHYGVEIAKLLKTEVCFLHLISIPLDWEKLPPEKEKLYPEIRERISDAKDALHQLERRAEKDGIEANSMLIYNTGVEDLPRYIKESLYEMVIMGTHGEKGLEKILGTNTQKVLRHSKVPVLAIKKHDKPISSLKRMLIATDFQEKSKMGFNKLIELARKLKLEIDLVYVNVPFNFQESLQIKRLINNFTETYTDFEIRKHIINANNEDRGIGMSIGDIDPGIVGVVTHNRSAFLNLFSSGITESVINNFDIPVLSVHS